MRSPLDAWIATQTGIAGPDRSALGRWQADRALRTALWAMERSPFYAGHLHAVKRALQVGSCAVADLPFVTAQHLREQGQAMLCVSQGEVDRVVTLNTSGTTGRPKRLFFTGEDLARTLDFFRVGMSTFTAAGDTLLIALPGRTPDGAADLLARAMPGIGARAVLAPEPCPPQDLAALALREGANVLATLASRLQALLACPVSLAAITGRVKTALLSGEPVPPGLRQEARRAGVEVFDHYGLTETCFGGGVECRAHAGYHLREADLYVEIIDPLGSGAAPDGAEGEVVLTTLGRRGMPLIRYRTGDLARILPGPCPCGSLLARLGPVAGRIERTGDAVTIVRPAKGAASAP